MSAVAEAQVIARQPDLLTSEAILLRAEQLQAQLEARNREEGLCQSAQAERQLQERSLQPLETERLVEHQGAER